MKKKLQNELSREKPKKNNLKLIIAGVLAGGINGFFGGGGGIAAVALLKRAGLETKRAHAAAVACVLPLCVVSGAVYLISGRVAISDVLPYVPGGLLGAIVGTALLKKLNARLVETVFAVLLIFMGLRLLNA